MIQILVGDETVELGAKDDNLQYRGDNKVEQSKLEHRVFRISLLDVLIDVRKVDALGYKGLVIAAVGVYHGHNKVHTVDIPQKLSVTAVAKAAFFITHSFTSFYILVISEQNCRYSINFNTMFLYVKEYIP